jgi:hypothetical protein
VDGVGTTGSPASSHGEERSRKAPLSCSTRRSPQRFGTCVVELVPISPTPLQPGSTAASDRPDLTTRSAECDRIGESARHAMAHLGVS